MFKLKKRQIYRLFQILSKRRKRQLYLLIILLIVNGFVESFSIATVIPFLSLASNNSSQIYQFPLITHYIKFFGFANNQIFFGITILFASFILFSIILRLFNLYYIVRFTSKISTDLSLLIFKNNIYQSYENYTRRNSSKVISLALEKVVIASSALNSLLKVIAGSIIGLFIVLSLLILKWQVLVIGFFILFIYYLIVYKNMKNLLLKKGKTTSFLIPERLRVSQEAFEGFRDVVINRTESIYIKLFGNLDSIIKLNNAKAEFMVGSPRVLLEGCAILILIFLGYKSYESSINISSLIPIIGTFIYAFQRLLPLTQEIFAALANYKYKYSVIKDLVDEIENSKNNEKIFLARNFIEFKKSIEFEKVHFSYDRKRNVLKNINLKIYKGEHIGIYGKTGSGKSTFLDLIIGLLSPTNGKILIDDICINAKSKNFYLTSKISHVPQSIFLKEGTIGENIAFGSSVNNINNDLLIKASKIAQIYDFIVTKENGFNTKVGERGIFLSGGQRQRIAIARAIYQKKDILILDEATSALDEITEKNILDEIIKFDKNLTIIMVTHRLKSLENFKRVFKVLNKTIIENK